MLDHSAQSGRHPLKEHTGDCYDTPPQAVHALLKVERLPSWIWEPCCGKGNIVKVLRSAGHKVVATDIRDRRCPDSFPTDFLKHMTLTSDAIVTNPPYSLAERFVTAALDRAPLVIMLLRLAFLESERRSSILDTGKLARVHVFKNRLPMMHRAGWNGRRASSAIAFAWFVWDQTHLGRTTIDRIRWEAE